MRFWKPIVNALSRFNQIKKVLVVLRFVHPFKKGLGGINHFHRGHGPTQKGCFFQNARFEQVFLFAGTR